METKTFREGIVQEDYLTKTLPFEYKKSTQEDKQFVLDFLLKINNNSQECLDRTLSVLAYSLLGLSHKEEYFWCFYGHGGNGKTMTLSILNEILRIYVLKVNSDAIVNDPSIDGFVPPKADDG